VSRPWLPVSVLAAGVTLISCFELSGPLSGVSAVSPIITAWPSVVVNDQLRDSFGVVTPLRVDVFDGDGTKVDDADVRFIALDTGLTVGSDGVVAGTRIRTLPARVVAQVRRGGDLIQTPEDSIDVVPRPDSLLPNRDTTFAENPFQVINPGVVTSGALAVTVLSRATGVASGVPVRSWIVGYEIVEEPQGQNGQHTALFTGAGETRFAYDTTDASGVANGRTIAFQRSRLVTAQGRHEVRVRATIRRIGSNDAPPRTVTFTLPFVGQ
jgi:hypothetical protein